MARRIASVRLQEPDDAEALEIVSGPAPALAGHHGVTYGDNVLDSAVGLSGRVDVRVLAGAKRRQNISLLPFGVQQSALPVPPRLAASPHAVLTCAA